MKMFFANFARLAAALLAATPLSLAAQFAAPVAVAQTNVDGAHIQFATPIYDFGKVSAGTIVKYDYIFTNTGNAMLTLSDVRPSCGCTTAGTWQRQVEPGKTGSIPIQFNSVNLSGPVQKSVSVTCNDSNQPNGLVMLLLKGTIWKPIDVTPTYAIFNPTADSQTNETKAVRIVNYTSEPLTLSAPESGNKSFSAEIKTITPGKEFELLITAVPPFTNNAVQTPILVKTSSTNLPVISVNAIAMVQQVISVMPNQITLRSAPLPPNTISGVTLRNNSATNVTITEPAIAFVTTHLVAGTNLAVAKPIPGVEASVQELQPGRVFNVVLRFPEGFEIPPGQRAELSLKTSHPQFPSLKVPIYQIARPIPTPALAPPQPVAQAKPPERPVQLPPNPGRVAAPPPPPPQPPGLPQ
jgi:hypothetical protein